MNGFLNDFRFLSRLVRKYPGLYVSVIVCLVLSTGSTLTIFSVISGVILQPLPFKNSAKLTTIWNVNPRKNLSHYPLSGPDFKELKKELTSCSEMSEYRDWSLTLYRENSAQDLYGAIVDGNFFKTLGVKALAGRLIDENDDKAGSQPVVVLSYDLWSKGLKKRKNVIGSKINLSGKYYTVIGILPETFRIPFGPYKDARFWAPLHIDPDMSKNFRSHHNRCVIARMKAGITKKSLNAEIKRIASRLEHEYPEVNAGWSMVAHSIRSEMAEPYRKVISIIFFAVLVLLIIALADVAILLMVQNSRREQELALKTIMGASRLRILAQYFIENISLSFVGTFTGVLTAWIAIIILSKINPMGLYTTTRLHMNIYVILFAFILMILVSIATGLIPGLQASAKTGAELKEQGRQSTDSKKTRKVMSVFVGAEVALCFAMLSCTGLLLRTFHEITNCNVGFEQHGVAAMRLIYDPASAIAPEPYFEEIIREIKKSPKILKVSLTTELPIDRNSPRVQISCESCDKGESKKYDCDYNRVFVGYFDTMGIPVLLGKAFNYRQKESKERVVIISRKLSELLYKHKEPINSIIDIDYGNGTIVPCRIIGVVGDVKLWTDSKKAIPKLYLPIWIDKSWSVYIVAKGSEKRSKDLEAILRSSVWRVNRMQAIQSMDTMKSIIRSMQVKIRYATVIMILFAIVSAILTICGIYSILAYRTRRRTREIGIRMVLGADASKILKVVVWQGLKPVIFGSMLGILIGITIGYKISPMLYKVHPWDPLALIVTSSIILTSGFLACLIPARYAARIQPAEAIRYE